MFDIGIVEFLALGILALVLFGPERLPEMAKKAANLIKQLRRMASNAQRDLKEELGPEWENFDPRDLNPRQFVRKHVLDDLEEADLDLREDIDVRDDLEVDEKRRSRTSRAGSGVRNRANGSNGRSTSTTTKRRSTTDPEVDAEAEIDDPEIATDADSGVTESDVPAQRANATGTRSKTTAMRKTAASTKGTANGSTDGADPVGESDAVDDADGAVDTAAVHVPPPYDLEAT